MSKKKYKKRHSQTVMDAKRQASQARLEEDRRRSKNRMDPLARNILWGDLVFLAVAQLLYNAKLIPDLVVSLCTIAGIILLLIALWLQFGKKKDDDGDRGSWPGMRG